jgi:tetratricopeptide (TPR) repeat protein
MRKRAIWIATLIVVVGLAAPLAAQSWKGTARATGIVKDADGKPVQGAKVSVFTMADPAEGPEAIETDKKGRWAVGGLSSGRWGLRIEAEGFEVLVSSVNANVSVKPPFVTELRPEGSGGVSGEEVRGWIEAGNGFLEQNKAAEARAEYVKALDVISGSAKAQVLMSVARTYYLENNATGAIASLERAIVAAPKEKAASDLYKSLMEAMERPAEAKAFLKKVSKGEITEADLESGDGA